MLKSAAAFTLVIVFSAASQVAQAQNVIQVNATTNTGVLDGNCEFKEAVQAAQTNLAVDGCAAGSAVNPDKIVFADALVGQTISYATVAQFGGGDVIIDSRMRQIILQATGLGVDGLEVDAGNVTLRGIDLRGNSPGNGITMTGGNLTIDNSSVEGRLGINAFGTGSTLTVNNSSIASTDTMTTGIGIRTGVSTNLVIKNSTIVAAVGKGLDVASSSGTASAYSTIVVGPSMAVNGSVATAGGTLTGTSLAGLATTLANNGGPTRTFALASGAAVDSGNCAAAAFPKYDQRFYVGGATGTRVVGVTCDVGAFEKGALADLLFVDGFQI